MIPLTMVIINRSMFSVALPGIRSAFGLRADAAAWMVTSYSLPFVVFMPLYGRLADVLNKRRLLTMGVLLFAGGTIAAFLAPGLPLFVAARVLQGVGSAAVTPVSMALISDSHPPSSRGKALGTWNSIGPVCFMAGPVLAGFLVDSYGWRAMFPPVLFVALGSLATFALTVPTGSRASERFLRSFDWPGALLLAGATVGLVFYMSSRPITGVAPLRDLRLLLPALALLAAFVLQEKRALSPFVPLRVFGYTNFSAAAAAAGIRMISMGGVAVLLPLMLRDVHDLSASTIGLIMMGQAAPLLATMRLGGALADRWDRRWPVVIGASGQVVAMALAGLAGAHLAILMGALVLYGLCSGLSLAALHGNALEHVPRDESGLAAGLYSMLRFAGIMTGSALAGVVLQFGLDRRPEGPSAYLDVFLFMAAVTAVGVLLGGRMRSRPRPAPAQSARRGDR
jgi:EmrB/QacA subfamily drug resistance transporter